MRNAHVHRADREFGIAFSVFNNLNYALLLTLNYYIPQERTVTATYRHLDYCGTVTVHTAGRNEEHADEEILQNNSLY